VTATDTSHLTYTSEPNKPYRRTQGTGNRAPEGEHQDPASLSRHDNNELTAAASATMQRRLVWHDDVLAQPSGYAPFSRGLTSWHVRVMRMREVPGPSSSPCFISSLPAICIRQIILSAPQTLPH
jgi:hypothetical protein